MPVPVDRRLVGRVERAELDRLLSDEKVVRDHDWKERGKRVKACPNVKSVGGGGADSLPVSGPRKML